MAKQIKIKRLSSTAKLPTKKSEDIGWDCYVDRIDIIDGALVYFLGIAVEPPEGYYPELLPRSSQSKTDWVFGNSLGVIDPTYRGELQVRLKPVGVTIGGNYIDDKLNTAGKLFLNTQTNSDLPFYPGDRIAQMILRPIIESEIIESDLSETERNDGGFGSTGK